MAPFKSHKCRCRWQIQDVEQGAEIYLTGAWEITILCVVLFVAQRLHTASGRDGGRGG